MKRDAIDFHAVRFEHEAIHLRLLNWARYVGSGRGGTACSPMFRLYRCPDTWVDAMPHMPVDTLDGSKIERAVAKLPEKHMGAVRWSYVYSVRGMGPKKACAALAVTPATLFDLVSDGRTMLKNRAS